MAGGGARQVLTTCGAAFAAPNRAHAKSRFIIITAWCSRGRGGFSPGEGTEGNTQPESSRESAPRGLRQDSGTATHDEDPSGVRLLISLTRQSPSRAVQLYSKYSYVVDLLMGEIVDGPVDVRSSSEYCWGRWGRKATRRATAA